MLIASFEFIFSSITVSLIKSSTFTWPETNPSFSKPYLLGDLKCLVAEKSGTIICSLSTFFSIEIAGEPVKLIYFVTFTEELFLCLIFAKT